MRDFAIIWLFFNTKFGRFVLVVLVGYIVIRIASWWLVPIIAALIAAFLFYDYYQSPKMGKKAKAIAKKELITAICLSAFALLFAIGILYYKYLEQQKYEEFYREIYDDDNGVGIDTTTVNEIQYYVDSVIVDTPADERPKLHSSGSYSSSRGDDDYDNMRGWDPASEDDMDDNGMSRYMENDDEEGWD